MSCDECPIVDGALIALTIENSPGSFEKLGFIKICDDVWKQIWDEAELKYIWMQTSREEWQVDVKFYTSKERNEFMECLKKNGIRKTTYRPRIDPTRIRRPDYFSNIRIGGRG